MNELLQQELFEASPDAIVLIDHAGLIVLVNKQLENLLGFSREELIGKPVENLVPQRFRQRHIAYRQGYAAKPVVRSMGSGGILFACKKDGSEVPVDIMLSPLRHKQVDNVQIIGTIRDATDRVRTEQRLSTSEAIFKALFDQAPDAIVAVNRQGKIARINHQTEVLFGYSKEELLGQPIEILVPERFRSKHVGQRRGYTANPASRPMGAGLELFGQRKDGSEVPVDIMLSPVQLSDEGLVISVIRDVTDRVAAQKALKERAEQLDRSNKELEMFAYVASHDLQEPLRAVASSCQILEKRLGDKLDGDTRRFLHFASDGAKRMRNLIEDLLAFSRVTSGENFSRTSLSIAVQRALVNLSAPIEESSARIVVSPSLPDVMADAGQLAQVFQNLIGNSLKFRREGVPPEIEISCRSNEKVWICAIHDNGIGIEPRFFDRIFTLFQRLHTRERYPGTGIGLAICKKIIERHGGRMWVEANPGQGSVFLFTLPMLRDVNVEVPFEPKSTH